MAESPRKERKKQNSFTALEIAEQVDLVREWLAYGYRPFQIRKRCSERWGLSDRIADYRIAAARKTALREISSVERQEMAAKILDTLDETLKIALATNQSASVIGLVRLQTEILGITGKGHN